MRIDEIDHEDADIDWFATDGNSHILHCSIRWRDTTQVGGGFAGVL
ncbi:hypothetical protein [Hymenobacter norwichensis]|nr:hypothetical protein [Hymenobacter norwichensis]